MVNNSGQGYMTSSLKYGARFIMPTAMPPMCLLARTIFSSSMYSWLPPILSWRNGEGFLGLCFCLQHVRVLKEKQTALACGPGGGFASLEWYTLWVLVWMGLASAPADWHDAGPGPSYSLEAEAWYSSSSLPPLSDPLVHVRQTVNWEKKPLHADRTVAALPWSAGGDWFPARHNSLEGTSMASALTSVGFWGVMVESVNIHPVPFFCIWTPDVFRLSLTLAGSLASRVIRRCWSLQIPSEPLYNCTASSCSLCDRPANLWLSPLLNRSLTNCKRSDY